jgi:hypothetical protein
MYEQPKDLQTNPSELNIYSKKVEGQTDQLFLRYPGNDDAIQLTAYQIYQVPTVSTQISYFTFLPGNLIIYFGSFSQLPGNKLVLTPPICTNVVGLSFCRINETSIFGSTKPYVEILQPQEGFVEGIIVMSNFLGSLPSYYIVVGNI